MKWTLTLSTKLLFSRKEFGYNNDISMDRNDWDDFVIDENTKQGK